MRVLHILIKRFQILNGNVNLKFEHFINTVTYKELYVTSFIMEQSLKNAITVRKIYEEDCEFPEWVIEHENWKNHKFSDTITFYHNEDALEDVKCLALEREPCNIGMYRLYDGDALQKAFGWKYGAYGLSTPEKIMPNIAVYCNATIYTKKKGYLSVHVLNCIGCALDSSRQPDFQTYKTKESIIGFYRNMWSLALGAMKHLKKPKFQIYNVGGGAFSGRYERNFTKEIFEPAFLPLVPDFDAAGIQILGYDFQNKCFTGGFIPDCLYDDTEDLENTVYVNAWDPWSLIGNGNESDNSLDGCWGRSSNMSVLGWLKTNPSMKFVGV